MGRLDLPGIFELNRPVGVEHHAVLVVDTNREPAVAMQGLPMKIADDMGRDAHRPKTAERASRSAFARAVSSNHRDDLEAEHQGVGGCVDWLHRRRGGVEVWKGPSHGLSRFTHSEPRGSSL